MVMFFEERTYPLLFSVLLSIYPMHLRSHVKHALRQLDTQTGALVDELIEELQHKIIRIAWFQNFKFADIQIPSCGIGFFVQALDDTADGVALGLTIQEAMFLRQVSTTKTGFYL